MNATEPREKVIMLLSGGLDSTVALACALDRYEVPLALTFYYGQRAWRQEREATLAIARHYGLNHQVVELHWLAELLPKAMTPKRRLPKVDDSSAASVAALDPVAQVWVPNRNGVFLNIAASFAEVHNAQWVMFGANADEAQGFPDNTQAYREALTSCFEYSTLSRVKVATPVGTLTKTQIVQEAMRLDAPLKLIWSCYEENAAHCGQCASCVLLKSALAEAGSSVEIPFLN